MAEHKTSCIVYCEWIHIFEGLEDDEAGRLIKHFFRYVNDQNPEPPDKITKVAFELIKQTLKRDLVKYEKVKVKRSISGRKGGEASGAKRSKSKQSKANEANASKSKQTQANEAVNVNVNDNEEKKRPSLEEFLSYASQKVPDKYSKIRFSLEMKYAAWSENGWIDGNGKKIKNWKTTLLNTLPHLKPQQNYGHDSGIITSGLDLN